MRIQICLLLLFCSLSSGSGVLAQSKTATSAAVRRLTVMIGADCEFKMKNASILEPAKIRGKEELKGSWEVESFRYQIEIVPQSGAFLTELDLKQFFPEKASKIWNLTSENFKTEAAEEQRDIRTNRLWCFDADFPKLAWRPFAEQRRLWMGIDGRSYFDGLYTIEIHGPENKCVAKIHYVLKAKRLGNGVPGSL